MDPNMMKDAHWVMTTKGGVGKTTMALVLLALIEDRGGRPAVVDCDNAAKIAAFLPDRAVVRLSIGATSQEIQQDPTLATSYWDKLAELMLAGDSLVDFGANVDRAVLEWALQSELGPILAEEGVRLTLWVPTTTDPLGVDSALKVLRAASELFPESRRILVRNAGHGSLSIWEGRPEMVEAAGLSTHVVDMPRCTSEGWGLFEKAHMPPLRVLAMSPAEIASYFSLNPLAAQRARKDLAKWMDAMATALAPIVFDTGDDIGGSGPQIEGIAGGASPRDVHGTCPGAGGEARE